jgi:ABC-type Zn uptake system ZnuABC Zn-binding protein ZnuA
MRNFLIILALIIIGGGAFYFFKAPRGTFSDRPVIAATIFPLYDITKNIAGDNIDVILLLPTGANPHTFEPTPSLVREAQNADAFFKIGYGLDDWVDDLADQTTMARSIATGGAETTIKRVDDNIALLETDGAPDPHYWLTIPNAEVIAKNITATLSEVYPERSSEFQANLDAYLMKLAAADQQIRDAKSLGQITNKNLVTMHDAWYYFADEYDLNIVGTFEPASGKEPTPQFLTELLTAVSQSGVRTIYSEPQSSDVTIQSFATDNHLNIAQLDDLGGVPGRMNYIDLMRYNAQTIAENQN